MEITGFLRFLKFEGFWRKISFYFAQLVKNQEKNAGEDFKLNETIQKPIEKASKLMNKTEIQL